MTIVADYGSIKKAHFACPPGFQGDDCLTVTCFGYVATDTENVCSSAGQCVGPDQCKSETKHVQQFNTHNSE